MNGSRTIEELCHRPSLRDIDVGARGWKWPIRLARRALRKLALPWIDELTARNREMIQVLAEVRAELDSHHRSIVDLSAAIAGDSLNAGAHARYRDLMIPYLHSLHVLERRVAELQGKQAFQVVPKSSAEAA